MNRPYYSEYVRHCARFYARNIHKPPFKTEVDKNNWYACHKAIERYSDRDRLIILQVYGWYDTIADNVYEVAKRCQIDQNVIWDLLKDIERDVAKRRGLL